MFHAKIHIASRRGFVRRASIRPSATAGRLLLAALGGVAFGAQRIGAARPEFAERFHAVYLDAIPQGIAAGDLNGDGSIDLAITHTGTGASSLVRVYQGDGRGGFASSGDFEVGAAPVGVAIGDLDADGHADIAVSCSGTGAVSLLRGHGDGTFEPQHPLESGMRPITCTTADVDGDGHDDLLAVNLGNGTFPPAPKSELEKLANVGQAWSDSSSVRLFLSKGRTPAAPGFGRTIDLRSGAQPVAAAAGDLDGDGHADVAVAFRGSGTLAVWFARPAGGFTDPQVITLDGAPGDVTCADVDRDGKLDLVSVLTPPLGQEQGRFAIAVVRGGESAALVPQLVWFEGNMAYRLVAADVDKDASVDLVVLTNGGMALLRGRGDGTFAPPQLDPLAVGAGHVVADVDGDGVPDVVTLYPRGRTAMILHGRGDGTFNKLPTLPTGVAPSALVGADLDGDGRLDLATAEAGGATVSVFLALPTGGFAARRSFAVGEGPSKLIAGDTDGDGDLDLIALCFQGRASEMVLLRNRGDGSFDDQASLASGIDPAGVVVADLDGDRHPDLVVPRSGQPEILIYGGRDRGAFGNARRIPLRNPSPVFAAGDLNADGRLDLVTCESRQGIVTVLLGNGDGTFTSALPFKSRYVPGALEVADVNGDGKQDLVVAPGQLPRTGAVLVGDGDGTFGRRVDFELGPGTGTPVVADLDGDGRLDLVVPDNLTGCVSVLPGVDPGFGPRRDFGSGPSPSAAAVLDTDGDGRLDLVVASSVANVLALHRNLASAPPPATSASHR